MGGSSGAAGWGGESLHGETMGVVPEESAESVHCSSGTWLEILKASSPSGSNEMRSPSSRSLHLSLGRTVYVDDPLALSAGRWKHGLTCFCIKLMEMC